MMDTLTTPLERSEFNQISDKVHTTRFMNQARDRDEPGFNASPLKGAVARQYYNNTVTEESATNGRNQSHLQARHKGKDGRDEISPTVMTRMLAQPISKLTNFKIGPKKEGFPTSDFIISKHDSSNSNEEGSQLFF